MNCPGLFFVGTDTGVGKTFVTALVARALTEAGLDVGVYKPACSGSIVGPDGAPAWGDVNALRAATGHRHPPERIAPQCFAAPLAPPVAARLEGRVVDARLLREGARWWEGRCDVLLVEGVGGLLCPLTERETVADLAVDLALPVVIVARLGLGTINHTLLTVEAAQRRGLPLTGIVLSQTTPADGDPSTSTNPAEIASRCDVPVLGVVHHGQAHADLHRESGRYGVDWASLAQHRG